MREADWMNDVGEPDWDHGVECYQFRVAAEEYAEALEQGRVLPPLPERIGEVYVTPAEYGASIRELGRPASLAESRVFMYAETFAQLAEGKIAAVRVGDKTIVTLDALSGEGT